MSNAELNHFSEVKVGHQWVKMGVHIIYCVLYIVSFYYSLLHLKKNVSYSAISSKYLNSGQNYSITISNKIIEFSNDKNDLSSGVTNRELGCCFFNANHAILGHLPYTTSSTIYIIYINAMP